MPKISKIKLIAKQALKIANLEAEIARLVDDRHSIQSIIYCVGGPLNDNDLQFTKEQLVVFTRISAHSTND